VHLAGDREGGAASSASLRWRSVALHETDIKQNIRRGVQQLSNLSFIGITRSPLKSHRFSDLCNNVSMKTLFKLFINHGNHDDSFVEIIIHICKVFGYDLLRDLLEMLNLINIGSAVATRRNLVDPIQWTNMRGLMAAMFRAFDLRT
jgi:hypothetical protein